MRGVLGATGDGSERAGPTMAPSPIQDNAAKVQPQHVAKDVMQGSMACWRLLLCRNDCMSLPKDLWVPQLRTGITDLIAPPSHRFLFSVLRQHLQCCMLCFQLLELQSVLYSLQEYRKAHTCGVQPRCVQPAPFLKASSCHNGTGIRGKHIDAHAYNKLVLWNW